MIKLLGFLSFTGLEIVFSEGGKSIGDCAYDGYSSDMHWLIVEEVSDRPAKPEIVAKDVLFSMRVITLDNETDSNILAQVKKKL